MYSGIKAKCQRDDVKVHIKIHWRLNSIVGVVLASSKSVAPRGGGRAARAEGGRQSASIFDGLENNCKVIPDLERMCLMLCIVVS